MILSSIFITQSFLFYSNAFIFIFFFLPLFLYVFVIFTLHSNLSFYNASSITGCSIMDLICVFHLHLCSLPVFYYLNGDSFDNIPTTTHTNDRSILRVNLHILGFLLLIRNIRFFPKCFIPNSIFNCKFKTFSTFFKISVYNAYII